MRVLLVLLVACASTPPEPARSHPRGPHADDHLDAAREHARRADELSRWPEMRRSDIARFDDPNTGLWYRSIDHAAEEDRRAASHRAAAAELSAAYDDACANIAPERQRISPLQRYGKGATPMTDGVVVFLGADAGPPERLLAELHCHRAWMRLSEAGMEHSPLDLPGLRVSAHGDATGISVELRARDQALIPELQRRTAIELEVAKNRSAF